MDDEESSRGTTWGEYRVVGTWDGARLTVTEPAGPRELAEPPDPGFSPACEEPTGDPGLGQTDSPGFGDIPELVRSYVTQDPFVVNLLVRPGAAEAATASAQERWGGLLCVAERDEPTIAELEVALAEVNLLREQDRPLGELLGSGIYALEPAVHVSVTVLTEEGQ